MPRNERERSGVWEFLVRKYEDPVTWEILALVAIATAGVVIARVGRPAGHQFDIQLFEI